MIEVLKARGKQKSIVYVTKEETTAISTLRDFGPENAVYYNHEGKKIGYHWALDRKEVANFLKS